MPLRIGTVLIIAFTIEALAIIVLVLLVALFGPPDTEAAQEYAKRVGNWVGPIAGFILCIAGGWYIARKQASHKVLNGLVLGATVAVIDISILVAASAEFEIIFVLSNIGRIIAGTIGGWLASKRNAV